MADHPASGVLVAILPCSDLDASERFYNRLGFTRNEGSAEAYRVLTNGKGGILHLRDSTEGWLEPGRNPAGLYLLTSEVDLMAAVFSGQILGGRGPADKPWGMYEFALSDPDETLVRVGWPTALR